MVLAVSADIVSLHTLNSSQIFSAMSGKRGCCVVGCTNNHNNITAWKKQYCEIHEINHGIGKCICLPPFVLLTFPTKDIQLRNEWIKRINRKNWQPNADSRICSKHFINCDLLEKKVSPSYPYPTLYMGYQLTPNQAKEKRKPPTLRLSSPPTKKLKAAQNSGTLQLEGVQGRIECELREETVRCETDVDCEHGKEYVKAKCHGCDMAQAKIKQLQKELFYWQRMYASKQQKPFGLEVLSSDSKVQSYTGLSSRKVFDGVFKSFGNKVKNIRRWKGPSKTIKKGCLKRKGHCGPPRFLTAKEEYFMTLFRTRTMLKADVIGDLFGVSSTVVSRTCMTWWKFMAGQLKCLVYNPPKEAHQALLPSSFNTAEYRNVRHIVDCTEIFTETPKNKNVQAVLWSNYKHHNTAKFLVSVTANGHINYNSKGYGGRASDRQIFENCGLLDEIEKGEMVMVDKGFNVEDLVTMQQANVIMPPGRRGACQMPKRDVHKTKQIANRRIRVEQVIRRLKCFNILKYEVPITLLHVLDDIFTVCCAFCNLMPPISKQ